VGSLLKKDGNKKRGDAMFTYSNVIVGFWLVPVVLCILVPLVMLCVWWAMQVSKKMTGKIEQIEKSAKENRDESPVEGFQPQSTA